MGVPPLPPPPPPGKNDLPGVEIWGTAKDDEEDGGKLAQIKLTQPEIRWWPALKRVLQNTDGLASLFLRAMADQTRPSRPTCH